LAGNFVFFVICVLSSFGIELGTCLWVSQNIMLSYTQRYSLLSFSLFLHSWSEAHSIGSFVGAAVSLIALVVVEGWIAKEPVSCTNLNPAEEANRSLFL
jgi:hypothetical protein